MLTLEIAYSYSCLKFFLVIRQLLIFSITSPIFGIITFFIFRTKEAFELVDSSRVAEEIRHQTNLAICLLFSAGTFLFVATVHALPEIRSSMKNEESDIPGTNVHQGLHWAEVSAIALGILLPAFVNIDAAHGH